MTHNETQPPTHDAGGNEIPKHKRYPGMPTSQAIIQLKLALGQDGRLPRTRGPVVDELKRLGLVAAEGFRFFLTETGRDYITQYNPEDESTYVPGATTATYPEPGSEIPGQPGYVVGRCGHRVAGSEWRAGFRTCERCPE